MHAKIHVKIHAKIHAKIYAIMGVYMHAILHLFLVANDSHSQFAPPARTCEWFSFSIRWKGQ